MSSEDLALTPAAGLWRGKGSGNANDLTNCKLYDGSTVVIRTVNPTSVSQK